MNPESGQVTMFHLTRWASAETIDITRVTGHLSIFNDRHGTGSNVMYQRKRGNHKMDETILQIIPAPADMWVKCSDGQDHFYIRVVCLALVETADGYRSVKLMDVTDGDGQIDFLAGSNTIVYSATDPNV